MLMLKEGVRVANRDVLKSIRTPDGEGRWKPVPHFELANACVERAKSCGLVVQKEEWGVVGKERSRLYGVLKFAPDHKLDMPSGMAPCMGVRSSFDKKVAIGIAIGATVFCCENGALSGDYTIRKLHTTGFNLTDEIETAFQKFNEQAGTLTAMVRGLQALNLTDKSANHLIVNAFRHDVMPGSFMMDVIKEYHEPRHPEFKPRNAWSLYNAFTEVVKARSPGDQMKTLRGLNKFLVAAQN